MADNTTNESYQLRNCFLSIFSLFSLKFQANCLSYSLFCSFARGTCLSHSATGSNEWMFDLVISQVRLVDYNEEYGDQGSDNYSMQFICRQKCFRHAVN